MTKTLTLIAAMLTLHAAAQNTGDYNSAGSGPWNAASTWLRFNGSSFVPAPAPPIADDGQVVILPGHTVTVSTPVTIDQVFVAVGATLINSSGTFTLANGPGTDLSVNGTWQLNGATIEGPGNIVIANGGTLNWTSGGLAANSTLTINAGCTVNTNGGALTLPALAPSTTRAPGTCRAATSGSPASSEAPSPSTIWPAAS